MAKGQMTYNNPANNFLISTRVHIFHAYRAIARYPRAFLDSLQRENSDAVSK